MNISPEKIGFDIDGVVADTMEAFIRLAREEREPDRGLPLVPALAHGPDHREADQQGEDLEDGEEADVGRRELPEPRVHVGAEHLGHAERRGREDRAAEQHAQRVVPERGPRVGCEPAEREGRAVRGELAQARDAFVGTGLQDATGAAGRHLGVDLELRVQWRPTPWLAVDAGYEHWFKGSYLDRVPNTSSTRASTTLSSL